MFFSDYEEGAERRELLEKLFAFMDAHPIQLPIEEEIKEVLQEGTRAQETLPDDDAKALVAT